MRIKTLLAQKQLRWFFSGKTLAMPKRRQNKHHNAIFAA